MTTDGDTNRLPNGAAWAAILASGIGCAAYGFFVDLAEASRFCFKALNFYNPAGNLSGKTTLGILVWVIAWVVLHARWKNKDIASPGKIMALTLLLIMFSLLATFPPFFELFAAS